MTAKKYKSKDTNEVVEAIQFDGNYLDSMIEADEWADSLFDMLSLDRETYESMKIRMLDEHVAEGGKVSIQLMHGDCLDLMKAIPDGSVDMILCDLPYGTTQNKWDSVIPFAPLWAEYRRLCKPSAAITLTAQAPFDKVLGASNIGSLRYEWIWKKSKATGHLNSRLQPMKNHENILVFYDERPIYNPQGLLKLDQPKIRKGGNNGTNYGDSAKDSLTEFGNYPKSIICIPSEGKTQHPTQKPVALMEYLIRTYTNEGETVLDNCMGSGTTGVACVRTGRKFIGIEKDEGYFQIAKNRIEQEQQKLV